MKASTYYFSFKLICLVHFVFMASTFNIEICNTETLLRDSSHRETTVWPLSIRPPLLGSQIQGWGHRRRRRWWWRSRGRCEVAIYCKWWQQGHNVEVRVLSFEVVAVRSYSHISDHRSFGAAENQRWAAGWWCSEATGGARGVACWEGEGGEEPPTGGG
jgi:hypothetical protein